MTRYAIVAVIIALTLSHGSVSGGEPRIVRVTPAALLPGATTAISIVGQDLVDSTELWTAFPSSARRRQGDDSGNSTIVYEVCPAAGVEVGVHAIRLVTATGISNLALVMIDDLPDVEERGGNRDIGTAQPLDIPVAVDGRCEEFLLDHYSFEARAGQSVSIEIVAQRLGSLLDPVLRILDARGREFVSSNDVPGIGEDARVRCTFARAGRWIVEIRDALHRGGEKFTYRLRIGDFPLAATAFPPGGQKGTTTRIIFADATGVESREIHIPAVAPGTRFPVGARSSTSDSSGFVILETGTHRDVLEEEPNDSGQSATELEPPCVINGRFQRPGDRDVYRFRVKKNQRLLLAGRTRSLGSPSHLFMELLDDTGGLLARADLSGADEGRIEHRFAVDGTCLLVVEEANLCGGPDHAYRIEVAPAPPAVTIEAGVDRVFVPVGLAFLVKVTCDRKKYKGPIELIVDGLGKGVTLTDNIVPENSTETTLGVRLASLPGSERLHVLRIHGVVTADGVEHHIPVGTTKVLGKLFPRLFFPPGGLDGAIAVAFRWPRREAF